MKKMYFVIPMLLISMISSFSFSSGDTILSARADSDEYVDLGKSINLSSATDFSAEYMLEKGILNSSFKENVSPITTTLLTQNYLETASYQAETFSNTLASNMETYANVAFPYECAMFDISYEFGTSMSVDYHRYQNQFFYRRDYQVKKFKLEIPNYYSYLQSEMTYSSFYLSSLNLVLTNQLTPSSFFDIFGTHLLVGGIYGGMFTSDYTLLTNQFSIDSSKTASIKTAVSASLANTAISSEIGFTGSVLNIIGNSTASVSTSYHAYSVGGDTSIASTADHCPEDLVEWYQTINSNVALILPSPEGLIPLSSAIPASFSSSFKETMANALAEYISEQSNDFSPFAPFEGINSFKINNFVSGSPNSVTVRSSEFTVDDDDPYDSDQDLVNIYQNNTLSSSLLYSNGFRYISFKIALQMKEIDPGYQEILVYNGSGSLIWSNTDIELGGANLQKNYIVQEFYCRNILLSSSSSRYLYIRYGAHGNGDDDWSNTTLCLDIVFSRSTLSENLSIDNCTTIWR